MLHRLSWNAVRRLRKRRGVVFTEYLLLLTLVGIGVLVGVAVLRNALVAELMDLATAISNINPPP